jgi:hypothetical protein
VQFLYRRQLSWNVTFCGSEHADKILLKQVNGYGQQDDILHEERNVSGHCWEPGNGVPAIRHKGNDGDRAHERANRSERAQDSQLIIPEAKEQKRTEQPFRNTEEPARSADAKDRIELENQRSVADIGD